MRKKNPNFNRENKFNRNNDSSEDKRASGRRGSYRRGTSNDTEKGQEGNTFKRSKRNSEKNSGPRKKYTSDRKPFDREKDSNPSDQKEARPFGTKRKGITGKSKDKSAPTQGRPFHDKRTNPAENKSYSGKRPEKENSNKKSYRPFGEKRGDQKFAGKQPISGTKQSDENALEKRPFRMDKPGKKEGTKGIKPIEGKRKNYKKYRVNKRRPEEIKPDDGLIRLNKYVANAGICSRREADEFIKTGVVEVNGVTITEMGYKVKADDDVRFDGERISPERKAYVLLNKPKGFITTTKDEKERKTVMELVANATSARLFPVGRLDRQTTGVLLFTNDGHLAKKLTHPSHGVKKIYHVMLDKDLHGDDMGKIREGIPMQEGVAKVDKISFIDNKPHNEVGVEIHIGWNRVVRRIFEKLGYKIMALDRVEFAGLTKKSLKRGDYRILAEKEVNFLKMI